MSRVTLSSRLPEIAAELRPRVSKAVKTTAEAIAEDARTRVALGPPAEHIKDNINVVRAEAAAYRVQVDATDPKGIPYGFAVEFGSTHAPAYPFLIPAAEAHREFGEQAVEAALRNL